MITLTQSAADRVLAYMDRRGDSVGLRFGVKITGCSGWAYVVNYADEVGAGDVVFDSRGVQIVVHRDSLELLDGTEIDFVKSGLNEAFTFRNPNVAAECGCGESFSVD